jgi:hypothetical protein
MLPEMAEQTPLEFLPLMPYSTEPMESLLLKKNERWWTYLLWLFSWLGHANN